MKTPACLTLLATLVGACSPAPRPTAVGSSTTSSTTTSPSSGGPLASAPPPTATPSTNAPPADDASDWRPKGLRNLPALSKSGGSLAYYGIASNGGDGQRYGFFILDVKTDKTLTSIPIDMPDETDTTARDGRIASAVAALAGDTWTPLSALTMESDPIVPMRFGGVGQTMPQVGTNAHLEVHFKEPELTVKLDGKVVLSRNFPAWSDKPHQACTTCMACPAALADLEAAWVDEASRLMLVEIRYGGGTDTCWERASSYHAVKY